MREWFILMTPLMTAFIGGWFTVVAARGKARGTGADKRRVKSIAGIPITRAVLAAVCLVAIGGLVITTYVTWRPVDSWESWSSVVYSDFERLDGDELDKLTKCIRTYPAPFSSQSQSGRFFEDMRAGSMLLRHEGISAVLRQRFGIYGDSFTGIGFSVPWDKTYSQCSSREYLAPNVLGTDKDVWTWILDPAFTNYGKKVSELLRNDPATVENRVPVATYFDIIEKRMREASTIPPLIRFQKLRQSDYSGRVGRPDAYYVFFSNLHDVWDMTIEQAAEASGYRVVDPSSDKDDTKLFIWLYVPSHASSARQATWRNVFEILENRQLPRGP